MRSETLRSINISVAYNWGSCICVSKNPVSFLLFFSYPLISYILSFAHLLTHQILIYRKIKSQGSLLCYFFCILFLNIDERLELLIEESQRTIVINYVQSAFNYLCQHLDFVNIEGGRMSFLQVSITLWDKLRL